MTNDRFLIVSYFAVAALSAAIGVAVYVYLRRSFEGLMNFTAARSFAAILKRLFPFGIVFPALLGFASVSYWSCNKETYEKVVQDRIYLIQKSQEQIGAVFLYLMIATLLSDSVQILIQKFGRSRTTV